MVEPNCEQIHKWNHEGKPVKYVRLDHAGEKLQVEGQEPDPSCIETGPGIHMDTKSDTPV